MRLSSSSNRDPFTVKCDKLTLPGGQFWILIPLPDLWDSKGDRDHNLTSIAKYCGFTSKLRLKSKEVYSQTGKKDFKYVFHSQLIIDH